MLVSGKGPSPGNYSRVDIATISSVDSEKGTMDLLSSGAFRQMDPTGENDIHGRTGNVYGDDNFYLFIPQDMVNDNAPIVAI